MKNRWNRHVTACMAAACLLLVQAAHAQTWKSNDGKYTVEAEYVELDPDAEVVILRKPDGKTVRVPLNKLSRADQQFAVRISREKEDAPAPREAPTATLQSGKAAIAKALSKKLKTGHEQILLDEAVDFLQDYYRIQFFLHRNGLKKAGVDTSKPVKLTAGATLEQTLDKMLDPLSLTWLIKDDVLMITSRKQAEAIMSLRVYRVRGPIPSEDELIKALAKRIAPNSWEGAGPAGAYLYVHALCVRQSGPAHREIVRQFGKTLTPVPRPATKKARDLSKPVTCAFDETRLSEAVAWFAKEHDAQLDIDEEALDEAGLSGDDVVQLELENVPLLSALRLMLVAIDDQLTLTAKGDRLVITTNEAANEILATRTYNVARVIVPKNPDWLVYTIKSSIGAGEWEELAGVGQIQLAREKGTVVVKHRPAVLAEIDEFLTLLKLAHQ